MVHALDDLAECPFADDLDELISVGNVVVLLDFVVAFFVVESVVDQALQLSWLYLRFVCAQIVDVLVFLDFVLLEVGQKLV